MRAKWLILFLLSLTGYLLLVWCEDRASALTMINDGPLWPRPLPYPDGGLLKLDQWYDAHHPAPPGTVKIESEWPRLRRILAGARAVAILLCQLSMIALIWPMMRRSEKHRGFEVQPRDG